MREYRVGTTIYSPDVWGDRAELIAHKAALEKGTTVEVRSVQPWEEFEPELAKAERLKQLEEKDRDEYQAQVDQLPKPQIGRQVYVDSSYYDYGSGCASWNGGLATISSAQQKGGWRGATVWEVTLKEHPGAQYSWAGLCEKQDQLAKEFGSQRASYYDPICDDADQWEYAEVP